MRTNYNMEVSKHALLCGAGNAWPNRSAYQSVAFASGAARFSQCSLQSGIQRAEKPGQVLLGQRSRSAGTHSELPKVPRYLASNKRVADIRLRPVFAGWRDDPRPPLQTARRQRDIGRDAHVDGDMCSAIQSSAASALSQTRTMRTFAAPGGLIGCGPFETTNTLSWSRTAMR